MTLPVFIKRIIDFNILSLSKSFLLCNLMLIFETLAKCFVHSNNNFFYSQEKHKDTSISFTFLHGLTPLYFPCKGRRFYIYLYKCHRKHEKYSLLFLTICDNIWIDKRFTIIYTSHPIKFIFFNQYLDVSSVMYLVYFVYSNLTRHI